MSKYTTDLVSTHSGFMGKYELDLVITTVGSVDFSHQVVIRDAVYRSVPYSRNFPTFRHARLFFNMCLEREGTLTEVTDVFALTREFYDNESQG